MKLLLQLRRIALKKLLQEGRIMSLQDDELSWLFTPDSELFILFAENNQILLKISVIPILLTFMYLEARKPDGLDLLT